LGYTNNLGGTHVSDDIPTAATSTSGANAPADNSPPASNNQSSGIGVSYDQALTDLNTDFNMKDEGPPYFPGAPTRFEGSTPDGSALIEVIGEHSDVSEVCMAIDIAPGQDIQRRNVLFMIQLLSNIAPDWDKGANWLDYAAGRITNSGSKTTTMHNGIVFTLNSLLIKGSGGVIFLEIRRGATPSGDVQAPQSSPDASQSLAANSPSDSPGAGSAGSGTSISDEFDAKMFPSAALQRRPYEIRFCNS